jgi:hypothetical protein
MPSQNGIQLGHSLGGADLFVLRLRRELRHQRIGICGMGSLIVMLVDKGS